MFIVLNDLFLFCGVMLLFQLFYLMNQGRTKGGGWSTTNQLKPPVILLLAVPRRFVCSGSLVILDVVCRYLSLIVRLAVNTYMGNSCSPGCRW